MWATVPPSMHTLPRISHCPAGGAFSGNVELKVGASRPKYRPTIFCPPAFFRVKRPLKNDKFARMQCDARQSPVPESCRHRLPSTRSTPTTGA